MQIEQQRQGAVTVVKPVGPLVGEDADQFRGAISEVMQASLGRFVVDASAVPFADSRGLEVLLEITDELASSGRALHLCGASDTLREVLDLVEMAAQFEYDSDVNTAVRSFL